MSLEYTPNQANRSINKLLRSDIKKFQSIYAKHYGHALTDDDAREQLTLLVRQVGLIYQPISINQLDNLLSKEERN